VIGYFPSTAAAGRAVSAIVRGSVPWLLELMDRRCLGAVEIWLPTGVDASAAAMLLIQVDRAGIGGEARRRIESLCLESGATHVVATDDPEEGERLIQARRMALPALERLGDVLLDDVAVPIGRLANLLDAVDTICRTRGVSVATLGHAGDGNMHPSIVFDAADPVATEAAHGAFDQIVRATLDLGGTVTGEHGIGLLKRRYLGEEIGHRALDVHRSIERALDPLGLLNPGKGF
jgi:glycolate oxidase